MRPASRGNRATRTSRVMARARSFPGQALPAASSSVTFFRKQTSQELHLHANPQVIHGSKHFETPSSSTWVQSLATISRHPDGLGGGPLRHVPSADGARLSQQFCHRTGSKLRLTSSIRSNATMNSQRVPIARPMARTVSTSLWKVPHKLHWPRHPRDVKLGDRSEANRGSLDLRSTLRRRPGKAAQRTSLPRKRTATRPLRPLTTSPGPNSQKPQPISHGPISGMYPESLCQQMASRAITAARAPCTRRVSRSDHLHPTCTRGCQTSGSRRAWLQKQPNNVGHSLFLSQSRVSF